MVQLGRRLFKEERNRGLLGLAPLATKKTKDLRTLMGVLNPARKRNWGEFCATRRHVTVADAKEENLTENLEEEIF